jgi:hypothetical protein
MRLFILLHGVLYRNAILYAVLDQIRMNSLLVEKTDRNRQKNRNRDRDEDSTEMINFIVTLVMTNDISNAMYYFSFLNFVEKISIQSKKIQIWSNLP